MHSTLFKIASKLLPPPSPLTAAFPCNCRHIKQCARWVPTETGKCFLKNWGRWKRVPFYFIFSLGLSQFGCTFCCTLCPTRRPWRTSLWRYSPEVITAPSWTPKELLFLLPTPIFGLDRSKKSFKPLPDVWGGEKKHSKQPNSSFTVSTAKLLPGPPRNSFQVQRKIVQKHTK